MDLPIASWNFKCPLHPRAELKPTGARRFRSNNNPCRSPVAGRPKRIRANIQGLPDMEKPENPGPDRPDGGAERERCEQFRTPDGVHEIEPVLLTGSPSRNGNREGPPPPAAFVYKKKKIHLNEKRRQG